jgi:2-polyprenyl-6-methoxyphenol hydroxylase-like FAD-dependent oxidoreductase
MRLNRYLSPAWRRGEDVTRYGHPQGSWLRLAIVAGTDTGRIVAVCRISRGDVNPLAGQGVISMHQKATYGRSEKPDPDGAGNLSGGGFSVKIVCVGGGPAGLYFALLMKLCGAGHDVTVFERNEAGSSSGWGVTFDGDLLEKLYRGDPVSALTIDHAAFRWAGQGVDIRGNGLYRASGEAYSIKRQRLLDIIADRASSLGVRVEFGHEVRIQAQLPAADLIVACDGANSRIRNEAGSFQTDVRTSGHKYVWLGTDRAFESFLYAFAPTDSGLVWAYAYSVDAESSTFIVECPQETWAGLGFDTMPPDDCLRLLEKLFARQLEDHQLAGQVHASADVRWQNFRTVTNQRWHDGRIVLAGDAAHTTHYSIGWGTKLAIEDAIALAENLQQNSDPKLALRSYERQRRAALLRPQSEARLSARWFENIPRYIDLKPHQFAALLHERRSPLLPYVPPQVYHQILRATEEIAILRELRRRAGPKMKSIYSKRKPHALLLGDLPWVEQVELDSPHDAGDAGLAGLAGGEVAGFLGFPGAGPAGTAADEESGHEDLQQERGEGDHEPAGSGPKACR